MKPRESSRFDKRGDRSADKPMLRKRARLPMSTQIDYKDAEYLRKFITERGKIVPSRFAGSSAKQQRQIKRAIRRARVIGLLP